MPEAYRRITPPQSTKFNHQDSSDVFSSHSSDSRSILYRAFVITVKNHTADLSGINPRSISPIRLLFSNPTTHCRINTALGHNPLKSGGGTVFKNSFKHFVRHAK
ncbi:hypothetical protein CEXT_268911 [Caerostris extrusa]|uniref:Uncharacterized protein n=1 Tax=Caerostris extrusa TaxID=172846 RepID=A0AAV4Y4U7_CAEEX|nr:hypothetical protein CEXT_268911 [Caerostris extrusa]